MRTLFYLKMRLELWLCVDVSLLHALLNDAGCMAVDPVALLLFSTHFFLHLLVVPQQTLRQCAQVTGSTHNRF